VWVLVLGMEENNKVTETHLTSAAAFVEGGVQDPCDDACSICLEPFTDDDPATVMFFSNSCGLCLTDSIVCI